MYQIIAAHALYQHVTDQKKLSKLDIGLNIASLTPLGMLSKLSATQKISKNLNRFAQKRGMPSKLSTYFNAQVPKYIQGNKQEPLILLNLKKDLPMANGKTPKPATI